MNRSTTPWIVVTSHRPIYTTQMCELGDYVVSRFMREALDSLFEKYRVNLALVAHTHAYERTCLIKGGECVESGGTQHITIGRESLIRSFLTVWKVCKNLINYVHSQYRKTSFYTIILSRKNVA